MNLVRIAEALGLEPELAMNLLEAKQRFREQISQAMLKDGLITQDELRQIVGYLQQQDEVQ